PRVGPVLLILAAPDQLRVQVTVAALVGHANGVLLLLLHHRLIFSGGNVLTPSLFVRERCNSLGVLGFPCHGVRSTSQKTVLDGGAPDGLAVPQPGLQTLPPAAALRYYGYSITAATAKTIASIIVGVMSPSLRMKRCRSMPRNCKASTADTLVRPLVGSG